MIGVVEDGGQRTSEQCDERPRQRSTAPGRYPRRECCEQRRQCRHRLTEDLELNDLSLLVEPCQQQCFELFAGRDARNENARESSSKSGSVVRMSLRTAKISRSSAATSSFQVRPRVQWGRRPASKPPENIACRFALQNQSRLNKSSERRELQATSAVDLCDDALSRQRGQSD